MTWAIVVGASLDFTNSLTLTITNLNKFYLLLLDGLLKKQMKRWIFDNWIPNKLRDRSSSPSSLFVAASSPFRPACDVAVNWVE